MDSTRGRVATAYNAARSTRTAVPVRESLRCRPTRLGASRHGERREPSHDSERGALSALASRCERRVEGRGGTQ